jgi:CBS domain-containing protein
MNHLLDIQIKDAAPHIFRRPFLFVEPNTRLLQIATLLAIGPQIYIDGLIVIDDKAQRGRPIGRISSKHIISSILDSGYPDWLQKDASQIMDSIVMPLEMDSPLKRALEVFQTTRFAFIPILAKKEERLEDEEGDSLLVVTASLAIRDILPIIAKANLSTPIKELSSQLISVGGKTSVRDALDYMLNKSIRIMGIKEELSDHDDSDGGSDNESSRKSRLPYIINDRKILEFLLSHNGRDVLRKNGIAGLADINIINNLDIISPTTVKSNTTVSSAAELLMDVRNPCLILEGNEKEEEHDYIVTPWDIVMKTLKSDHIIGGSTTHQI